MIADSKKLKVLLIIPNCNPDWVSVPLVGYRFYEGISQRTDSTLVTHERNKTALHKLHPDNKIIYIGESKFIRRYFKFVHRLSELKSNMIWPLYHALTFPVYSEFNNLVYQKFKDVVRREDYDIVHTVTPILPRYPVKIIKACEHTPFIIGPVNGGVTFPKNFKKIARQEFSHLNFLRSIGRFSIPGYRKTYEKADYILAGSTYTSNLLKKIFKISNDRIQIFYENGITESFLKKATEDTAPLKGDSAIINLLFVGRLVPYKGADILIDAINILEPSIQEKIFLNILGDGPEKVALENKVDYLRLRQRVCFTGWVGHQETLKYYRNSDIFCFPSLREFGGAVVLEAMANALPCIVINNGGIGEYVNEKTGFKINPTTRNFVVKEIKRCIEALICDKGLRKSMSLEAIKQAKQFIWSVKADNIIDIYRKAIDQRRSD